jgi:hypothetical protein
LPAIPPSCLSRVGAKNESTANGLKRNGSTGKLWSKLIGLKNMSATLVMDLTKEQGGGRETQVQPPKNVWVQYFEIDLDEDTETLPTLMLRDKKHPSSGAEDRPIVYHDHNWTLEIGDAGMPRPAILRLVQVAHQTYDYWVYRPGDSEFVHLDWLLDNVPNPHRTHGRRWLLI